MAEKSAGGLFLGRRLFTIILSLILSVFLFLYVDLSVAEKSKQEIDHAIDLTLRGFRKKKLRTAAKLHISNGTELKALKVLDQKAQLTPELIAQIKGIDPDSVAFLEAYPGDLSYLAYNFIADLKKLEPQLKEILSHLSEKDLKDLSLTEIEEFLAKIPRDSELWGLISDIAQSEGQKRYDYRWSRVPMDKLDLIRMAVTTPLENHQIQALRAMVKVEFFGLTPDYISVATKLREDASKVIKKINKPISIENFREICQLNASGIRYLDLVPSTSNQSDIWDYINRSTIPKILDQARIAAGLPLDSSTWKALEIVQAFPDAWSSDDRDNIMSEFLKISFDKNSLHALSQLASRNRKERSFGAGVVLGVAGIDAEAAKFLETYDGPVEAQLIESIKLGSSARRFIKAYRYNGDENFSFTSLLKISEFWANVPEDAPAWEALRLFHDRQNLNYNNLDVLSWISNIRTPAHLEKFKEVIAEKPVTSNDMWRVVNADLAKPALKDQAPPREKTQGQSADAVDSSVIPIRLPEGSPAVRAYAILLKKNSQPSRELLNQIRQIDSDKQVIALESVSRHHTPSEVDLVIINDLAGDFEVTEVVKRINRSYDFSKTHERISQKFYFDSIQTPAAERAVQVLEKLEAQTITEKIVAEVAGVDPDTAELIEHIGKWALDTESFSESDIARLKDMSKAAKAALRYVESNELLELDQGERKLWNAASAFDGVSLDGFEFKALELSSNESRKRDAAISPRELFALSRIKNQNQITVLERLMQYDILYDDEIEDFVNRQDLGEPEAELQRLIVTREAVELMPNDELRDAAKKNILTEHALDALKILVEKQNRSITLDYLTALKDIDPLTAELIIHARRSDNEHVLNPSDIKRYQSLSMEAKSILLKTNNINVLTEIELVRAADLFRGMGKDSPAMSALDVFFSRGMFPKVTALQAISTIKTPQQVQVVSGVIEHHMLSAEEIQTISHMDDIHSKEQVRDVIEMMRDVHDYTKEIVNDEIRLAIEENVNSKFAIKVFKKLDEWGVDLNARQYKKISELCHSGGCEEVISKLASSSRNPKIIIRLLGLNSTQLSILIGIAEITEAHVQVMERHAKHLSEFTKKAIELELSIEPRLSPTMLQNLTKIKTEQAFETFQELRREGLELTGKQIDLIAKIHSTGDQMTIETRVRDEILMAKRNSVRKAQPDIRVANRRTFSEWLRDQAAFLTQMGRNEHKIRIKIKQNERRLQVVQRKQKEYDLLLSRLHHREKVLLRGGTKAHKQNDPALTKLLARQLRDVRDQIRRAETRRNVFSLAINILGVNGHNLELQAIGLKAGKSVPTREELIVNSVDAQVAYEDVMDINNLADGLTQVPDVDREVEDIIAREFGPQEAKENAESVVARKPAIESTEKAQEPAASNCSEGQRPLRRLAAE